MTHLEARPAAQTCDPGRPRTLQWNHGTGREPCLLPTVSVVGATVAPVGASFMAISVLSWPRKIAFSKVSHCEMAVGSPLSTVAYNILYDGWEY